MNMIKIWPSREEDIETIQKLKDLIMNKENEVNKIKKLKEFFHLELLNREKNYNEVFGTTPIIESSSKHL